jgi:hypothetical protein
MDKLSSFILQAEQDFVLGKDKKELVISLFNSQLTDEQQVLYDPVIGDIIDLAVDLMKQPAVINSMRKCCSFI